jgi:acyl-CoA dehydrogenase
MADTSFLSWPFFEPKHRELAARLEKWCGEWIDDTEASNPDAACRALVADGRRKRTAAE